MFSSNRSEYKLAVKLEKHTKGVICLSFHCTGYLLASGGSDQAVGVWDIKSKTCNQILHDSGWGQVTCLEWIASEMGTCEMLCFGTARGLVLIFQQSRPQGPLLKLSSTIAFDDRSIKDLIFDPVKSRLATTSHNGLIKVWLMGKQGALENVWTSDKGHAIPRAIRFMDEGRSLVVFGLESGEIQIFETERFAKKWSKRLKSRIGNVGFCPDFKFMLIDNLQRGFDMYRFDRTSIIRSFETGMIRLFVRQVVFAESTTLAVAGSDSGEIHTFEVATGEKFQSLRHCPGNVRVQAVASFSDARRNVIASGGHDGKVCIWEREQSRAVTTKKKPSNNMQPWLNTVFLYICVMWVMYSIACNRADIVENVQKWTMPGQGSGHKVEVVGEHRPDRVYVKATKCWNTGMEGMEKKCNDI